MTKKKDTTKDAPMNSDTLVDEDNLEEALAFIRAELFGMERSPKAEASLRHGSAAVMTLEPWKLEELQVEIATFSDGYQCSLDERYADHPGRILEMLMDCASLRGRIWVAILQQNPQTIKEIAGLVKAYEHLDKAHDLLSKYLRQPTLPELETTNQVPLPEGEGAEEGETE